MLASMLISLKLKKENELTVLWKILNPQATRGPGSNLYATTASYANKRSDRCKATIKAHPETQNQIPKLIKDKKKPTIDPGFSIERALSPKMEKNLPDLKKLNQGSSKVASLNSSNLMSQLGKTCEEEQESVNIPIAEPEAISIKQAPSTGESTRTSNVNPEGNAPPTLVIFTNAIEQNDSY